MSDLVRKLWMAMAVLSCVFAFVFVFISDAATAFTSALAGVAFYIMAHMEHGDLD